MSQLTYDRIRDLSQVIQGARNTIESFVDGDSNAMIDMAGTMYPAILGIKALYDEYVENRFSQRLEIKTSVPDVETIAAPQGGDNVLLLDGSLIALYQFSGTDLSTEVPADTIQEYITPQSDATGASGAWVSIPLGQDEILSTVNAFLDDAFMAINGDGTFSAFDLNRVNELTLTDTGVSISGLTITETFPLGAGGTSPDGDSVGRMELYPSRGDAFSFVRSKNLLEDRRGFVSGDFTQQKLWVRPQDAVEGSGFVGVEEGEQLRFEEVFDYAHSGVGFEWCPESNRFEKRQPNEPIFGPDGLQLHGDLEMVSPYPFIFDENGDLGWEIINLPTAIFEDRPSIFGPDYKAQFISRTEDAGNAIRDRSNNASVLAGDKVTLMFIFEQINGGDYALTDASFNSVFDPDAIGDPVIFYPGFRVDPTTLHFDNLRANEPLTLNNVNFKRISDKGPSGGKVYLLAYGFDIHADGEIHPSYCPEDGPEYDNAIILHYGGVFKGENYTVPYARTTSDPSESVSAITLSLKDEWLKAQALGDVLISMKGEVFTDIIGKRTFIEIADSLESSGCRVGYDTSTSDIQSSIVDGDVVSVNAAYPLTVPTDAFSSVTGYGESPPPDSTVPLPTPFNVVTGTHLATIVDETDAHLPTDRQNSSFESVTPSIVQIGAPILDSAGYTNFCGSIESFSVVPRSTEYPDLKNHLR